MITYERLFSLLKSRGKKRTDLLEIISSQTLAKLGKNESVTTDTIDRICLFLEVQPSDIMEVFFVEERTGKRYRVKPKSIDAATRGEHIWEDAEMGLVSDELDRLVEVDENGKEVLNPESVQELLRKLASAIYRKE